MSTSCSPRMKQEVVTVGLDLAKNFLKIHVIASDGIVLIRRNLRRAEVVGLFRSSGLIGMEACASAHHWAREPVALGHEVRLIPPTYVKPHLKRGKNVATDSEAIYRAVPRPTMLKALHERKISWLFSARSALHRLAAQLRALKSEIDGLEARKIAWHRSGETSRRLAMI